MQLKTFRIGRLAAGAALLTAVLSNGAPGRELPRYGVFVYSNLCTEAQSGDTAGYRIAVFRYTDSDFLMFEYTEGAVMWPLLGNPTIDSRTGAMTFEVHGREPENLPGSWTFQGTITDDAIVGTLNGRQQIRLPRVRDFGRKQAECSLGGEKT